MRDKYIDGQHDSSSRLDMLVLGFNGHSLDPDDESSSGSTVEDTEGTQSHKTPIIKETQVRAVVPLGGINATPSLIRRYLLLKDIHRSGKICARPKFPGGLREIALSGDMEIRKELHEEVGTGVRRLEPLTVISDSRMNGAIQSVIHFYAAELVAIPMRGIVSPGDFPYDHRGHRTYEVMNMTKREVERECHKGSSSAVKAFENQRLSNRQRYRESLPKDFIDEVFRLTGRKISSDCEYLFTRTRDRPKNGEMKGKVLMKTDWCWHEGDFVWSRKNHNNFSSFINDYISSEEFEKFKQDALDGDMLAKYFI